jgi:prepilin-type N-terminal cleavage/methylation domain-containing protein
MSRISNMQKKGFSLIELLVVIAIIAILASIAIIQYNKYKVNAMYSNMEAQLQRAKAWAVSIVYQEGQFPNGTCTATEGTVKCYYDGSSIHIGPDGDLSIDAPFSATFTRNSTNEMCGTIIISCPADGCGGLKNHNNNGPAKLCVNTCGGEEIIGEDTNLHGVVNGGCP